MICPRCGFDNLPGNDTCGQCLCDLTALDRPAPQDRIEMSLMADTVATLKPRSPVLLPSSASVGEAVRLLLDAEIGAVLIVNAEGRLAGIFSERDLLTKVAGGSTPLGDLPLDQFMTPKPETVCAGDTLAYALHKMDVGGYRHLPVVDDGKPVGILSVRDLIRHMTQLCREKN